MIVRIILKLMETAVMDINTNNFRNFRRFFQNGDKIHSQFIFFCKKYCNTFAILEKSIEILQYCITEGLV